MFARRGTLNKQLVEEIFVDNIQQLIATEAIRTLKAKYCRAIDTKDGELLKQVFDDHVECDFRGGAMDPSSGINLMPAATESVLRGSREAIEALLQALAGVVSAHQAYLPEIELLNETTAKATWAMHDNLRFPKGAPIAGLSAYGYYHETYEYRGGDWRIKTLKLVRLRVDSV